MAWREQQRERERAAREREEEERKKREERIKHFLLHAPSPAGLTPPGPGSKEQATPPPPHMHALHHHDDHDHDHHQPPPHHDDRQNQGRPGSGGDEHMVCGSEQPIGLSSTPRGEHDSGKGSFLITTTTTTLAGSGKLQRPAPAVYEGEGEGYGASASEEIARLKEQLSTRDDEVRMLKEAYRERLREKEEEFKHRWAAQNEAEALAHKLNETEARLMDEEQEVKRLQEQVNKLEQLVKTLKKENDQLRKKRGLQPEQQDKLEVKGKKMIAINNFVGNKAEDQLSFVAGDVIEVKKKIDDDWWEGRLTNGDIGIFPCNYVQALVINNYDDEKGATDPVDEEQPQQKTLEKVAYAKKKIEERYKALTLALKGQNTSEHHTPQEGQTMEEKNHDVNGSVIIHHDDKLYDELGGSDLVAATPFEATILFDFPVQAEGELELRQGDRVTVLDLDEDGEWCYGRAADGREGHFPRSYISIFSAST